jgi:hypothetical protein
MTVPGIFLFTALMAVAGLAIDMQRVYGVHGQMQAFVDDVALAAAAELDGQNDAIARALNAACGMACGGASGPLVSGPAGSARFADPEDTTLAVEKVSVLRALGPDPGPLAATPAIGDEVLCTFRAPAFAPECEAGETVATASSRARFIEIVAEPRTVSYLVLPVANAFGAAFDRILGEGPPLAEEQLQSTLALRATAGFRRAMCNTVPLMVCNPAETVSGAEFAFDRNQLIERKIRTEAWQAGDLGVLTNVPGTIPEALARVSPGTICTEDVIGSIRTLPFPAGDQIDNKQAINVRFDMYEGLMALNSTNADYTPAPNVVKGMRPNGGDVCNLERSQQSIPFPRGNTAAATAAYWAQNHGGPAPSGNRYDIYRAEIDNEDPVQIPGDEQGEPACYANAGSPPDTREDHDRRILYVPVVNCIENAQRIADGLTVPVKAYAKIFLTEPVGNTLWSGQTRAGIDWPVIAHDDVAYEILDEVKPNDTSGRLHVYPVLFR